MGKRSKWLLNAALAAALCAAALCGCAGTRAEAEDNVDAAKTQTAAGTAVAEPEASEAGPPPVETAQEVSDLWIAACSDALTLRASPSTGAAALGTVRAGETLRVLSFDGAFARVAYGELEGCVVSTYLVRDGEQDYARELDIVAPSEDYGYDEVVRDLAALEARYAGLIEVTDIGQSGYGRDIPLAVVGDPNASVRVLVQGAIHGREYLTACLVMCQIEYLLKYDRAALEDACFYFVPMSNPDGCQISCTGVLPEALGAVYARDLALGYTALSAGDYARVWKANGAGVDLNRNFDAGWAAYAGHPEPSLQMYKGVSPMDQPESAALARCAQDGDFDVTLSYHCSGSVIYWEYGDGAANARSFELARSVSALTGYPLVGAEAVDAAGFKDWAIDALGVPSLTIEVGWRDSPLPLDEFSTIYARNKSVPACAAGWALAQN